MKDLTRWIFGVLFVNADPSMAAHAAAIDGPGARDKAADRWDEALLASMYDEHSCRLLEFWGTRLQ